MTSSTRSDTPLNVLFLGATGYIGASVLDRLIHQPTSPGQAFKIVGYVRNEEKAQKLLKGFGIKSIIGTLQESQKLEDAAASADVVINTASADHLASTQAVLRGLKKKFEQSGQASVYIHTSGTGVFADDANGAHGNAPTYDDTNVAQLRAIPDDAPHRSIDLAVLAADEAGYVRTYIVMPPVIYGLANGPLFDAKIANRHSILLPIVIGAAIERKRVGMFGEGRNLWPLVHINDMADLYVLVFNSIMRASEPEQGLGHGWEGFYFAENGTFVFKDLSLAVGNALEKLGKVTDATPASYTQEDIDKFYAGGLVFGSNSICTSKRARALGWNPRYGTEDFFASIALEVDAIASSGLSVMGDKLTSALALVESAMTASKAD